MRPGVGGRERIVERRLLHVHIGETEVDGPDKAVLVAGDSVEHRTTAVPCRDKTPYIFSRPSLSPVPFDTAEVGGGVPLPTGFSPPIASCTVTVAGGGRSPSEPSSNEGRTDDTTPGGDARFGTGHAGRGSPGRSSSSPYCSPSPSPVPRRVAPGCEETRRMFSLVAVSLAANLVGMVVASGLRLGFPEREAERQLERTTRPPGASDLPELASMKTRLGSSSRRPTLTTTARSSSGEAADFGARFVESPPPRPGGGSDGAHPGGTPWQACLRRAPGESRDAPATDPIKADSGRPDDKGIDIVGPRVRGGRPSSRATDDPQD